MEEQRCFNDWDLYAVVRLGCRRRLSPPPEKVNDPFAAHPPPAPPLQASPAASKPVPVLTNEADAGWSFPDLRVGGGQDGNELLRALLAAQPPVPSPLPTLPPPPPLSQQQQQQPVVVTAPADVPAQARAAPASAPVKAQPSGRQMPGAVPRSKRRKNQVKKVVCHVPADGSSSDVWAWRKYGQKPIKGSPYPRGYYRCSSSKGCAARKQVERCRTDPNTFILTYTGEHNHAAPTHRNSLAGTTRHKFPSAASPPPPSVVVGSSESQQQQQQTNPGPPSTSAGLSPTTPLRTPSMEEEDDEEEDELLVEDMEMAGEDELVFLNGGADSTAPLEPMPSLFDVIDEPFLGAPWSSAIAGQPAAGAAGAGS